MTSVWLLEKPEPEAFCFHPDQQVAKNKYENLRSGFISRYPGFNDPFRLKT
jgi:hypothetical protein